MRDSTGTGLLSLLSLVADCTRCHRCQVRTEVMEVEIIRRIPPETFCHYPLIVFQSALALDDTRERESQHHNAIHTGPQSTQGLRDLRRKTPEATQDDRMLCSKRECVQRNVFLCLGQAYFYH